MCFGKSRKEQCDIRKLYEIQISVSINSFIGIQPKIFSWPFMVKFAEPWVRGNWLLYQQKEFKIDLRENFLPEKFVKH